MPHKSPRPHLSPSPCPGPRPHTCPHLRLDIIQVGQRRRDEARRVDAPPLQQHCALAGRRRVSRPRRVLAVLGRPPDHHAAVYVWKRVVGVMR
eukprot:361074-Chlamydomonas_euryale.AAC.2